MGDEPKMIEIEEAPEASVNVLSAEEQAMAEKHGLIKKEEPKEASKEASKEDESTDEETGQNETNKEESEETETETEVESEEEPVKKEVNHSKDLDGTFESMSEDPEKEHEALTELSKEQKAYYFKWKKDKNKRQELEAKYELQQLEINQLKSQLQNKDVDPLDELLQDEEKSKPITREEYEADKKRQEQEALAQYSVKKRMADHNAEAKNKYDDYEHSVALAAEVMKSDESGVYYKLFVEAAEDPNKNSAEVAYKIGKLHPKYGIKTEVNTDNTKKLNKIKENAQKGKSSSSVPENNARRTVSEKELTVTDCKGMTTAKWRSLSPATRQRILQQSCA